MSIKSILLSLLLGSPTIKGDSGSSGIVGTPIAPINSPTVITDVMVHTAPAAQRRSAQSQQTEHLEFLLAKHHVNLANYTQDFFKTVPNCVVQQYEDGQFFTTMPGDKIPRTALGDLFISLNNGTFTPNTALNERWGDDRDTPKDEQLTAPEWYDRHTAAAPETPAVVRSGQRAPDAMLSQTEWADPEPWLQPEYVPMVSIVPLKRSAPEEWHIEIEKLNKICDEATV